jgi:uncharacterized repeat protein (TIGR01451 family)
LIPLKIRRDSALFTDRMRRLLPLLLAIAPAAWAHNIVDVGLSIKAPAFAAALSSVTYAINVTDFAYDFALGIVVTDTLPANSQFVSASGNGWSCSQSNGTVTCSAERLAPGTTPIDIVVKMPASGTAHDSVSQQPLGTIDPNPKNDSASSDTIIYDPAACTATAPQLLAPGEATELSSGFGDLAWTAVAGASRYRIWTAVEGAAATVVAETTATNVAADFEIGLTEWWVEADFGPCPPVVSAHRHFLSDGQPAKLNVTTFLALNAASIGTDLSGNIYALDTESSTMQQIAPTGAIVTVAGAAGQTGAGDGTIGFSRMNHPRAVAVTAGGYVYIADTDGDIIRQFFPAGNGVIFGAFLGTIAGGTDGNARFDHPAGIAVALDGSVLVADTGSRLVRRIAQPGGVVTTVASGFQSPVGIAVNAAGEIFVGDGTVIQKIATDGTVSVFASGFNQPAALAFDSLGNLYVADTGNNAIRRVAPSALVTTVVEPGVLNTPTGLAFDTGGRLLIADSGNHVIRVATLAVARRRSAKH